MIIRLSRVDVMAVRKELLKTLMSCFPVFKWKCDLIDDVSKIFIDVEVLVWENYSGSWVLLIKEVSTQCCVSDISVQIYDHLFIIFP